MGHGYVARVDDPRAHVRAARAIEARIADGRYAPGQRLHIGLIAGELGIYRAAVSRGLELLAGRGLVARVPGLGWYVEGPAPEGNG